MHSVAQITNALTIDVEEYFHPNAMDDVVDTADWDDMPHRVEANTKRVLDILDEQEVRATFFVLGWVAERWPGLPREIARRGHEVACHGHAHRLAYKLGPDGFRADIARAKHALEDCLGNRVDGFRAASYSIVADSLWAIEILIEEGFRYDSSIFPVRHDIYGIPGFSRVPVRIRCQAGEILEIPASTLRLFGATLPVAGGGYFRLLPYLVTSRSIRYINERDRQPVLVYLHPWELDPEQPRLAASRSKRFRQYANIDKTEPRLRRLLDQFRFAPIAEVFGQTACEAIELDELRTRFPGTVRRPPSFQCTEVA